MLIALMLTFIMSMKIQILLIVMLKIHIVLKVLILMKTVKILKMLIIVVCNNDNSYYIINDTTNTCFIIGKEYTNCNIN